jgi:hypothetical protein
MQGRWMMGGIGCVGMIVARAGGGGEVASCCRVFGLKSPDAETAETAFIHLKRLFAGI